MCSAASKTGWTEREAMRWEGIKRAWGEMGSERGTCWAWGGRREERVVW